MTAQPAAPEAVAGPVVGLSRFHPVNNMVDVCIGHCCIVAFINYYKYAVDSVQHERHRKCFGFFCLFFLSLHV